MKRFLSAAVVLGLAVAVLPSPAMAQPDWFEDVTGPSGIDFRYHNGATGKYYFPEIMGGGVALLDYNGNGLLDIYLVQGGAIGPGIGPADRDQGDRLYRNDSYRDDDGRWRVRFTDVTQAAGIDARGYGMGVAVGDYTASGYPDIYVLNFGDNQLWRNNGDGTFTDVTEAAGVNDPRWSVSASFADLDGDGKLDLYVANYVDYSFDGHVECRGAGTSDVDYCSPSNYRGAGDSLFRNLGDGRFGDVSETSGIASARGHGLGVIVADFDHGGRPEIFVANDGSPNFLWVDGGGMRYSDEAFLAGAAVNRGGSAEAGMGVDAADFDGDGLEDIFITHMRGETNTLYVNVGDGWFEDRTARFGLGVPSIPYTGFGTAWLDIDNNGWLDLVAVNGAVMKEPRLVRAGDAFPYHQRNQIFENRAGESGSRVFAEATARGGAAFEPSLVSRGAAFGDLNNNGRTDLVIVNINGPARILLNRAGAGNHWLGLRLLDAEGRRDLVGALAWLVDDGDVDDAPLMRRSRADGSYASANDPRVRFGLGGRDGPRDVRVRWPDGKTEVFSGLEADRYHELKYGTGQ